MFYEKFKKLIAIAELALALVFAPILIAQGRKMIQVKGSDTMINLVQILAEEYMNANPKATPIAVLGGGSGTGITALINSTCDIADHSRDFNEKEFNQAWERGVKPRVFAIAVDGLSIVVNEKNPLNRLTMDQVGAIYRGDVKNWRAFGGPAMPISLYGRQSNSGTYTFLQEHVLKNKNYSPDVKEMNGNAQIIEGVLADEAGVGYVGVGYVVDKATGKPMKGLKVLGISKDEKSEATSPMDKEAVDTGKYPIARALWQSTNGKPGSDVAAFIQFELGPEGQKIVEREGFYPLGAKYNEANAKNLK
jgi:phosphate transport system substrate-binding protein